MDDRLVRLSPASPSALPRKAFFSLSRSLLWNLFRDVSDPDLGVHTAGVPKFLGELMKDAPVLPGELDRLEPLDCGVLELRLGALLLGQLG